jgi:hypothetical protein
MIRKLLCKLYFHKLQIRYGVKVCYQFARPRQALYDIEMYIKCKYCNFNQIDDLHGIPTFYSLEQVQKICDTLNRETTKLGRALK